MTIFTFNRTGGATIIEKQPSKSKIKNMTKSELSRNVADLAGFSKTDVEKILDCYLNAITASLKEDRPVTLLGFGKFKPRKPRTGSCRNPTTGKKVRGPKLKSICFQPSLIIKQKLSKGERTNN